MNNTNFFARNGAGKVNDSLMVSWKMEILGLEKDLNIDSSQEPYPQLVKKAHEGYLDGTFRGYSFHLNERIGIYNAAPNFLTEAGDNEVAHVLLFGTSTSVLVSIKKLDRLAVVLYTLEDWKRECHLWRSSDLFSHAWQKGNNFPS